MGPSERRAMFERQLEMHPRAVGGRPNITEDELFDVRLHLERHASDLRSLVQSR